MIAVFRLILALGCVAVVAAPRVALAQFSIGSMAGFGVIIDSGSTLGLSSSAVAGNVGFSSGASAAPAFSGGTVRGAVDYAGTVPSGVVAGSPGTGTGGTQTSIVASVGRVSSAITTMQNLSTTYGTTGTSLSVTAGSGTQTLTLPGSTVYDVTSWNLSSGGALTISASAGTYVVFDFSVVPSFNGSILLTGGITPNQVLFNYTGTSTITGTATNGVINGVIDAPTAAVQLSGITVNGGILASSATTGTTLTSTKVNAPEPATITVLLAGIGGLAAARKKRRASV